MIKLLKIFFLGLVFQGVALAAPLSINGLQGTQENKINIVAFVTSWCPPCKETTHFLMTLAKQNKEVAISLLFVDETVQMSSDNTNLTINTISLQEAKKYGVERSVPYILIFDKSGKAIKIYHTFNPTLITKLVNNLKNGLYENGTLPQEQRIDLWQKERF
ncbi:MAG: thioredoxin domain-containing protein [Arcobacteraceae bacterium]|nr:thioredoxin domain-containing protein [Arcobacteraceae bacterium]